MCLCSCRGTLKKPCGKAVVAVKIPVSAGWPFAASALLVASCMHQHTSALDVTDCLAPVVCAEGQVLVLRQRELLSHARCAACCMLVLHLPPLHIASMIRHRQSLSRYGADAAAVAAVQYRSNCGKQAIYIIGY